MVNDERQLADLVTPSQWHTLADVTSPADLVWSDADKHWLLGMRRPLLGQQADRLARDPHWHDAAEQITSRWTTVQQEAETRHAQLRPTRPPTQTRIDPAGNHHGSAHPDPTSAPAGEPSTRCAYWRVAVRIDVSVAVVSSPSDQPVQAQFAGFHVCPATSSRNTGSRKVCMSWTARSMLRKSAQAGIGLASLA